MLSEKEREGKGKNSRTESKVKVMSGEIWANEVKVSRTLLTGLKLTGKQNVMLAKENQEKKKKNRLETESKRRAKQTSCRKPRKANKTKQTEPNKRDRQQKPRH